MIEIENLSITFGEGASQVHAVRNVSFSVAEGESYGLVGESGSGKSTILRAIARINPHWSGTIRVNGRYLTSRRTKAEARAMQMVFQDPYGALTPATPSTPSCASRWRSTACATATPGSSARSRTSVSAPSSASAIPTRSPAASASASPSPAL